MGFGLGSVAGLSWSLGLAIEQSGYGDGLGLDYLGLHLSVGASYLRFQALIFPCVMCKYGRKPHSSYGLSIYQGVNALGALKPGPPLLAKSIRVSPLPSL